jgi:predicted transcriptional regulator
MKILLDEDLEIGELKPIVSNPNPKVEIIKAPELGRPDGAKNIPELTKKLIAIDSVGSGLSQEDIAKIHGVTQESVSHISRGWNGTNIDSRKKDEALTDVIETKRAEIKQKSADKLFDLIDFFEPSSIKQKDIPNAALKMAGVIHRLEEKREGDANTRPQFIIFAPRVNDESAYEVITVNEG